MKFDDLDLKMRVFETAADQCVLPGVFMVARLDGRGFTALTKERHAFAAPFDERFRDMMLATLEHLMTCGFRAVYGYTQSDEISVLFHRDEETFNRKQRKYHSILAGEASAKFSLLLGAAGVFDCRISQLPGAELVRDYFRWRNEDAHRNALNAHGYWMLRNRGATVAQATAQMLGMSVADKNELLYQGGVNFNDLPAWQKRGVGMYWETYEKESADPRTGAVARATRRRLKRDFELPMGDAYGEFILRLVETTGTATTDSTR